MQQPDFHEITIDSVLFHKNVEILVLRLDRMHPVISGNKWFKLQFYLEEATRLNKKNIATYGGAYSNHIIATAAACKLKGFSCTGIIRGEKPPELSHTLVAAQQLDMRLLFISREDYALKIIPEHLKQDDIYLIPEGGYGEHGAKGASTISNYFPATNITHICCAVGTGTMMAGLINAATSDQTIIGISVLKNNMELENNVRGLVTKKNKKFELIHEYHFGGYAKSKSTLIEFMNNWYRKTEIPSDFVYTGKLFFAVEDLISKNYFPPGSRLLIIHSGGLQGNNSLPKGTLIFQ